MSSPCSCAMHALRLLDDDATLQRGGHPFLEDLVGHGLGLQDRERREVGEVLGERRRGGVRAPSAPTEKRFRPPSALPRQSIGNACTARNPASTIALPTSGHRARISSRPMPCVARPVRHASTHGPASVCTWYSSSSTTLCEVELSTSNAPLGSRTRNAPASAGTNSAASATRRARIAGRVVLLDEARGRVRDGLRRHLASSCVLVPAAVFWAGLVLQDALVPLREVEPPLHDVRRRSRRASSPRRTRAHGGWRERRRGRWPAAPRSSRRPGGPGRGPTTSRTGRRRVPSRRAARHRRRQRGTGRPRCCTAGRRSSGTA